MPQKKRIKQIEKQQQKTESVGIKEKAKVEKIIGSINIPELESEDLMEQLNRMKAITPTQIAIQFNIKISLAKRLLEELRNKKIVELVSRSHNLKIYTLNAD